MNEGAMVQHKKTNQYLWLIKENNKDWLVFANVTGVGVIRRRIDKKYIGTKVYKCLSPEEIADLHSKADANEAIMKSRQKEKEKDMATTARKKSKKTQKGNGKKMVTHEIRKRLMKGATAKDLLAIAEKLGSPMTIVQSELSRYRGKKVPGFRLKIGSTEVGGRKYKKYQIFELKK